MHRCETKLLSCLYQNHPDPPSSVVLVGHSMGGVIARALFSLPRFNPRLVSLILTQASPHQAPVLSLDPFILGKNALNTSRSTCCENVLLIFLPFLFVSTVDFYSMVRRRWSARGEDLRNVTVLSVGGGYRDYQVRSGLTTLTCPVDDHNKMAVVVRKSKHSVIIFSNRFIKKRIQTQDFIIISNMACFYRLKAVEVMRLTGLHKQPFH